MLLHYASLLNSACQFQKRLFYIFKCKFFRRLRRGNRHIVKSRRYLLTIESKHFTHQPLEPIADGRIACRLAHTYSKPTIFTAIRRDIQRKHSIANSPPFSNDGLKLLIATQPELFWKRIFFHRISLTYAIAAKPLRLPIAVHFGVSVQRPATLPCLSKTTLKSSLFFSHIAGTNMVSKP